MPKGYTGLLVGCPIPRKYFESRGRGESDFQVHAGSYHMAMQAAGVERFNLMPYTSILPAAARRVSIDDAVADIPHGSEMKVIQAAAHVDRTAGETRATAAIIYGLLRPKNRPRAAHIGGLVCEYNGPLTVEEARQNLEGCLKGLHEQTDRKGVRFSDSYDLTGIRFISETATPTKRFGTALVVIGFADYIIPVKAQNVFPTPEEANAFAESAFGKTGF